MQAFVWDTYFVTGIAEVDGQHFHLVELLNNFGHLITNNALRVEEVQRLFTELDEYAVYHFHEEEMIMKNAGIAAHFFVEHIQGHHLFLEKVADMRESIAVENLSSARQLLDFLTHWIIYHILGMDQNMARQLELIESGYTPEEAFKKASCAVDRATAVLLNALSNLFMQVSDRNNELKLLNKTLEIKVEQRTQELQEANQHLEHISKTDPLTSLPNRRYAMSHLSALWEKALCQNNSLSCLMIDADHFKAVNDTYGHDMGDKVLIALSQNLQQMLRNDDTLCRLGGDEFLIICENTDIAGAKYIAQLLCDSVSKLSVATGTGSWTGSISIGAASKQDNMRQIDELIKMADQGVYLAKEAGKNCVKSVL